MYLVRFDCNPSRDMPISFTVTNPEAICVHERVVSVCLIDRQTKRKDWIRKKEEEKKYMKINAKVNKLIK